MKNPTKNTPDFPVVFPDVQAAWRWKIHDLLSREMKLHLTQTAWAMGETAPVKLLWNLLWSNSNRRKNSLKAMLRNVFQPLNNSRHSMEHFNKHSNFSYKHNRVISKNYTHNITEQTVWLPDISQIMLPVYFLYVSQSGQNHRESNVASVVATHVLHHIFSQWRSCPLPVDDQCDHVIISLLMNSIQKVYDTEVQFIIGSPV